MTTISSVTRPADLELEPPAIRISESTSILETDLGSVPVIVDELGKDPVSVRFSDLRATFGAAGTVSPIGDRLRVAVLAISADPVSEYPAPVSERILEIVAGSELRIIAPWQSTSGTVAELLESGADLVLRISE